MDMEKIDKEDKAGKEIESSLEDIENFAEGNYKQILQKSDVDKEDLKELTERAEVSKVMGKDLLEAKGKREDKD